ncbi:TPA: nucleotide pyrophosphohydrolase [Candidatus Saccharibacteria bacterium]|nr:nucleotide pyrophosphohydrolase [Candidatus Saccharibacteria bacterium]HIO87639.1 nucleotide pyrophosphohydrolase [Candidatus Saccharibacteria bacterium]
MSSQQQVAQEIANLYACFNAKQGNKQWEVKDYLMGFLGDVGDLSKLVMAQQGMRKKDDVKAKLEHELADCLWSLLVLASKLDVDLDKTYKNNMKTLKERVEKELAA